MSNQSPSANVPPPPARRIIVSELMAGQTEVVLVHNQQEYHLRVTKNGKLILTK